MLKLPLLLGWLEGDVAGKPGVLVSARDRLGGVTGASMRSVVLSCTASPADELAVLHRRLTGRDSSAPVLLLLSAVVIVQLVPSCRGKHQVGCMSGASVAACWGMRSIAQQALVAGE